VPGRRRQTLWVDTLHTSIIASGGEAAVTLQAELDVTQAKFAGLTLVRVILCHDYSYAIHDSGEGSAALDIGIGLTSQEAFAAAVHPDPNVTTDHPTRGWIYRCRHKLHGFAADQAAVDVRTVYRDLRAKRKIENGELYMTWFNTLLSGTASSVQVVGITRCLFELS